MASLNLRSNLAAMECYRLSSFPRSTDVRGHLATSESLLANLHASSEAVLLVLAADPVARRANVLVGRSANAVRRGGAPDPLMDGAETVDSSQLHDALARHDTWSTLIPETRLDVGWVPVGLETPDLLDHLRLLEDLRNPVTVTVAIELQAVHRDHVEDHLADALRWFSPEAIGGSAVSFDQWKSHHHALTATTEFGAGLADAVWDVRVHFGGPDAAAIGAAASAVNQALLLTTPFELNNANVSGGSGLGTSRLVAALGFPPVGEVPGFRRPASWFFDQTQEGAHDEDSFVLADILSPTRRVGGSFSLAPRNLVRHTLVTGATGSGKTETVKALIDGLPCPWLIIEPAKSEYRYLRSGPDRDEAPFVIRPGDPTAPPLQLNPLEPHPGFSLRTHLDLVLALFLAAFDPIDPLPQVLASALEETYRKAGWVVPLNHLRTKVDGFKGPVSRDYPNLGDLQVTARSVVENIGYGREALDNVRGFVDVRLGSLRLGTAGRMFENGHPLDVTSLMSRNVVVELDDMGNDQEKSFVMGVLLVRLYEHLRCEMDRLRRSGTHARPLSHVTIVEEAHRLLRAAVPGEKPNFAIETFANMLAELRSYGEGLIIVEQVPSKIISDAVKNTGTKILHRLPSLDDREFAGGAANLAPEQYAALGALPPGEAIAFTDEMDRPTHVRVRRRPALGREAVAAAVVADTRSVTDARSALCIESNRLCTMTDLVEGELSIEATELVALWVELSWHSIAMGKRFIHAPASTLLEKWKLIKPCAWCRLASDSVAARRPVIHSIGSTDPEDVARRLHGFLRGIRPGKVPTPTLLDDYRQDDRWLALARGSGQPWRAILFANRLRAMHPTAQQLEKAVWGTENQTVQLTDRLPGLFLEATGSAT